MNVQELYTMLHGNYADALNRLMNDKLITKFVLKFPADNSITILRDAVAAGDISEQFRGAHTLKGVAANLAFTELQQAASDLTEQLRDLSAPADPALLQKVEDSYALVIDALGKFEAE